MNDVVDLSARRKPVRYTVEITHHWDDTIEVFVRDVSGDERSRASVADALYRAAEMFGFGRATCSDCPLLGYPTDTTRCSPCPLRDPEAERKRLKNDLARISAHADGLRAERDHLHAELSRLNATGDLLEALKAMVEEKADYMRLNQLGDPETQHTVKLARVAIAKAEARG